MAKFDLQPVNMTTVRSLCTQYHGYASAGSVAVYAWAVMENGKPVAAFSWQPPPPSCAVSVCPEAPYGVLALSRMVAVPRSERQLKHISKPLRHQMKYLIDRTRWPVLVTFSDEGQGHTGYVYQCSNWTPTQRRRTVVRTTYSGERASRYSNGTTDKRSLFHVGTTWIQRWEHWACYHGEAAKHMAWFGWERVPINRYWKSGAPAYQWVRLDGIAAPAPASTDAAWLE
jgi:hypothetical protein